MSCVCGGVPGGVLQYSDSGGGEAASVLRGEDDVGGGRVGSCLKAATMLKDGGS